MSPIITNSASTALYSPKSSPPITRHRYPATRFPPPSCVGYSTITLRSGALCSGASFNTIAKKTMRLSEIVVSGYDEATWCGGKNTGFKNQITISVYDAYGNVAVDGEGKSRSFMFTRAGKSGKWTEEGYWHRVGESTKITSDYDETFKMGEGLWVQTSATAYKTSGCGPDQYKLKFPGIDDTYVEDAE